jgi:hypothetical protein
MHFGLEWRITNPPPGGLTSVTLRFTDDEVRALVAATTDGTSTPSAGDCRAIVRPIALLLQGAIADGTLVLDADQE